MESIDLSKTHRVTLSNSDIQYLLTALDALEAQMTDQGQTPDYQHGELYRNLG